MIAGSALEWSGMVHPSHTYDQLLTLSASTSGAADVMVRIIRTPTPNQTLILIEPVSRLEISAKDIRTRIQQVPTSGYSSAVTRFRPFSSFIPVNFTRRLIFCFCFFFCLYSGGRWKHRRGSEIGAVSCG